MDLDNYINELIEVKIKEYLDGHFKDYISSHTGNDTTISYNRKEAAKITGLSVFQLKELCAVGKIKSKIYNNNTVLIEAKSLREYCKSEFNFSID